MSSTESRRGSTTSTSVAGEALEVLCISLVMIVMANASLNVALPTLADELHAELELAAVDRRRLQPRVRRVAADGRFAR